MASLQVFQWALMPGACQSDESHAKAMWQAQGPLGLDLLGSHLLFLSGSFSGGSQGLPWVWQEDRCNPAEAGGLFPKAGAGPAGGDESPPSLGDRRPGVGAAPAPPGGRWRRGRGREPARPGETLSHTGCCRGWHLWAGPLHTQHRQLNSLLEGRSGHPRSRPARVTVQFHDTLLSGNTQVFPEPSLWLVLVSVCDPF